MTDAELIERLRKADEYEPLGHDGWEAADRIEELVERNKELTLQLLATHGQAADSVDKLAKAADMMLSLIAMIQHAIGPGKDVFIEPDTGRKLSDARATLAEIKGESHE